MAAAGLIVLHFAAAGAMWLGATVTGAPLALWAALMGALNTAPIAWLALAAAAFAVGWLPAVVGAVGAVPVVGGFLLNVVTQNTAAPRWLVDLSPFGHLAAVPAAAADWSAVLALVGIGAVASVLGVTGYTRRDLTS